MTLALCCVHRRFIHPEARIALMHPEVTEPRCYHKMIARQRPACYRYFMNKAQRRTLEAMFSQPVPATLEWRRIEPLFVALGAQIVEGEGSRVRFLLNGIIATFRRPHPSSEAKPYQVRDARRFLESAGVKP